MSDPITLTLSGSLGLKDVARLREELLVVALLMHCDPQCLMVVEFG